MERISWSREEKNDPGISERNTKSSPDKTVTWGSINLRGGGISRLSTEEAMGEGWQSWKTLHLPFEIRSCEGVSHIIFPKYGSQVRRLQTPENISHLSAKVGPSD